MGDSSESQRRRLLPDLNEPAFPDLNYPPPYSSSDDDDIQTPQLGNEGTAEIPRDEAEGSSSTRANAKIWKNILVALVSIFMKTKMKKEEDCAE